MQVRPVNFVRFVAVAGMVGFLTAPAVTYADAFAGIDQSAAPVAERETAEQGSARAFLGSNDNAVSGAKGIEAAGDCIPGDNGASSNSAMSDNHIGSGDSAEGGSYMFDTSGMLGASGEVSRTADASTGFDGLPSAGGPSGAPAPSAGAGATQDDLDSSLGVARPVGINVSAATLKVGSSANVSIAFEEGDVEGYTYNYVWAKADWSQWSSTVRERGKYTSDTSWEFCPTQAGSYILAVDVVRGDEVQTFSAAVEVKPAWTATGLSVTTSNATAGLPVEVAVTFEDGSMTQGLSFNYVWMKDDWNSWGSTAKDGLKLTDPTYSFALYEPGLYTLYVDVADADGTSVTLSTAVTVGVQGYGLNISLGDDDVVMTPIVPEGVSGLRFNYVWQLNGSWTDGDWGSTSLADGGPTTNTTCDIPLRRNGTYTLYLDVLGPDGLITTISRTVEVDGFACFSDILASSPAGSFKVGSPIDISLITSSVEVDRYKYNVGWAFEDWSAWASTVTQTGNYGTSAELQFVPTKPGRYSVFVDVVDTKTGITRTLSRFIDVELGWSVCGLNVSYAGLMTPSSTVVLEPSVQGDAAGFTYNYVWQGNDWANWDSTVHQTGSATAQAVGSVSLAGAKGYYKFNVDVTDKYGNTVTYGPQVVYASYQMDFANRVCEVASDYFGTWSPEPFESAVLEAGAPLCYGKTGYFCGAFVWWCMSQAGCGDKYCGGNVIVEPRLAMRYYQSIGLYDPDIRNVSAGDIVFMAYEDDKSAYPASHIMYCLWADDQGYMAVEANNGPCGMRYYSYDFYANAGFGHVLY